MPHGALQKLLYRAGPVGVREKASVEQGHGQNSKGEVGLLLSGQNFLGDRVTIIVREDMGFRNIQRPEQGFHEVCLLSDLVGIAAWLIRKAKAYKVRSNDPEMTAQIRPEAAPVPGSGWKPMKDYQSPRSMGAGVQKKDLMRLKVQGLSLSLPIVEGHEGAFFTH